MKQRNILPMEESIKIDTKNDATQEYMISRYESQHKGKAKGNPHLSALGGFFGVLGIRL